MSCARARRQREPPPDRSPSAVSPTATARRAATTAASTRPTCSAARTSRARRCNLEYDVGDWTLAAEEGFGAKLEPIRSTAAAPGGPARNATRTPGLGALPGARGAGVDLRGARPRGRRVQEGAAHRRALHQRVRQRQRARDARTWAGVRTPVSDRRPAAAASAPTSRSRASTSSSSAAFSATGTSGTRTSRRRTPSTWPTRSRSCTRSAAGSSTTTTSAPRQRPTR